MKRSMTNAQAEDRAEEAIADFQRRAGRMVSPPIPVERVLEEVFELRILWEPIAADGSLAPLAGLRPRERQVVVNESFRDQFEQTSGLLEFSLAHEAGHWDLHVDKSALAHPTFDGLELSTGFGHFRSSGGTVRALLGRLRKLGCSPYEAHDVVRDMTRAEDDFFESRQADRYAAALLMPRSLVLETVAGRDLLNWQALYLLRDEFHVSTTAMKIRLETLGLIYVAPDNRIHRSRAEAMGQTTLL